MEELFYCCECQSLCNTTIIDKKQTLTIKGREITLMAPVRECTTCGEEILDEEMDMATLRRFYNEYRKLENLLLPDEIRAIRQKYNLSQSSFAKLLGFGEKTISRYENGAIQDVCHDNMIRLMESIDSFSLIWKERKGCLSQREQIEIDSRLNAYYKARIHSTYKASSKYYSTLPNLFLIQGDFSDAG